MPLLSGMNWMANDHIPQCAVTIDCNFRNEWAINYARTGSIIWSMNNSSPRVLSAPVVWWTWPGPKFNYGARLGETWDHTYFAFSGFRVQRWIQDGLMPIKGTLPFRNPLCSTFYNEKFDQISRRIAENELDRATLIIEEIWLELHDLQRKSVQRNPHYSKITAFLRSVRENPQVIVDEKLVAKTMGISSRQFTRLCKAECGLPPHQFYLKCRMERAVRLLKTSQLPLKIIAAQCGFDDIYYFSKFFHKNFGVPPGRYRSIEST